MYKLKDIFTLNLNSRGGVKLFNKIANKYNLNKEDRKDLMNVEVGSSEGSNGFQYKSRKVCWQIDNTKINEDNLFIYQLIASYIPIYSLINHSYDDVLNKDNKTYLYLATPAFFAYLIKKDKSWNTIYFEEAESSIIITDDDMTINTNGVIDIMTSLMGVTPSEEQLYEDIGLKSIPYEEYINMNIDKEIGKELVNE